MSQGFGSMGVGVLADDGGDDTYTSEAASQGAGVFGIGLVYDGGGDDTWRTWAFAQGFGYVGSGGLAYDRGGDDVWWSDPGNDFGGTTIYYSPQLASGQGNSSFSQGAGFGLRGDAYELYLAGGIGVLRGICCRPFPGGSASSRRSNGPRRPGAGSGGTWTLRRRPGPTWPGGPGRFPC